MSFQFYNEYSTLETAFFILLFLEESTEKKRGLSNLTLSPSQSLYEILPVSNFDAMMHGCLLFVCQVGNFLFLSFEGPMGSLSLLSHMIRSVTGIFSPFTFVLFHRKVYFLIRPSSVKEPEGGYVLNLKKQCFWSKSIRKRE